ncbi:unnamed protein product [Rotaria socialis]|uniref:Uncharacterized protein n=1 Tax=Rotaria socialis TaxID=392032 RepID=A0A821SDJ7_9BILA|nr:unnamed protein product [Rotaria socialis]
MINILEVEVLYFRSNLITDTAGTAVGAKLQDTAPKKSSPYSDKVLDCKGRACASCGHCRDWHWCRKENGKKDYEKRTDATCTRGDPLYFPGDISDPYGRGDRYPGYYHRSDSPSRTPYDPSANRRSGYGRYGDCDGGDPGYLPYFGPFPDSDKPYDRLCLYSGYLPDTRLPRACECPDNHDEMLGD